jgi:hypothetical protein
MRLSHSRICYNSRMFVITGVQDGSVSLRAVQLTRGCTPRVTGIHKRTTMTQLEVAQGSPSIITMISSAQDHHVINSANARQGNAVGVRATSSRRPRS